MRPAAGLSHSIQRSAQFHRGGTPCAGPCANRSLHCACTNDHFALLAGPRAQHAYLVGFGADYCRRSWPLRGPLHEPSRTLAMPGWGAHLSSFVGMRTRLASIRDVRSAEQMRSLCVPASVDSHWLL